MATIGAIAGGLSGLVALGDELLTPSGRPPDVFLIIGLTVFACLLVVAPIPYATWQRKAGILVYALACGYIGTILAAVLLAGAERLGLTVAHLRVTTAVLAVALAVAGIASCAYLARMRLLARWQAGALAVSSLAGLLAVVPSVSAASAGSDSAAIAPLYALAWALSSGLLVGVWVVMRMPLVRH